MRTPLSLLLAFALLDPADAAEVCGDAVDQDLNNVLDEGCNGTAVTSVCESPLSCAEGGAVSPRLGGLVWTAPHADIAFTPPVGPSIELRRTYQSRAVPPCPARQLSGV